MSFFEVTFNGLVFKKKPLGNNCIYKVKYEFYYINFIILTYFTIFKYYYFGCTVKIVTFAFFFMLCVALELISFLYLEYWLH